MAPGAHWRLVDNVAHANSVVHALGHNVPPPRIAINSVSIHEDNLARQAAIEDEGAIAVACIPTTRLPTSGDTAMLGSGNRNMS